MGKHCSMSAAPCKILFLPHKMRLKRTAGLLIGCRAGLQTRTLALSVQICCVVYGDFHETSSL